MALESCLRVSTPRPHCLPPLFSSSKEKLVFSTQKVGFKKSVLNSTLSLPSGVAYRKSRFVCNAREAVNEGTLFFTLSLHYELFSIKNIISIYINLIFALFVLL